MSSILRVGGYHCHGCQQQFDHAPPLTQSRAGGLVEGITGDDDTESYCEGCHSDLVEVIESADQLAELRRFHPAGAVATIASVGPPAQASEPPLAATALHTPQAPAVWRITVQTTNLGAAPEQSAAALVSAFLGGGLPVTDAVDDAGFDQVLHRLLLQAQRSTSSSAGTPEIVIQSLHRPSATELRLRGAGDHPTCGVCLTSVVDDSEGCPVETDDAEMAQRADEAAQGGAPNAPSVGDAAGAMIELPCSHVFHESCLRPWLEGHHTCPSCRSKLPTAADL